MLGIVECGFQKWISELLYNQNKAIKSFFLAQYNKSVKTNPLLSKTVYWKCDMSHE